MIVSILFESFSISTVCKYPLHYMYIFKNDFSNEILMAHNAPINGKMLGITLKQKELYINLGTKNGISANLLQKTS